MKVARRGRKTKTDMGIGHLKAEVVIRHDIPNPSHNPRYGEGSGNPKCVSGAMNLRESPIAMMYAKGALDQAQLQAANRFRRLWETCGGKGAGSFDYTREQVDGGGPREPITDQRMDAGKQLKAAEEHLGRRPYAIVAKVAGEGVAVSTLGSTHREKTTLADYLKDALTDLACLWGYRSPQRTAANQR